MSPLENYECIHESQIQEHSLDIKELQTEMTFKKEKIDKLQTTIENIDGKLDKVISRSEERDNITDTRLTQLETSQKNMKWFVSFGFSVMGIVIGVLGVIMAIMQLK